MLTVQISEVQDCDVMPYLVSQSNFSCAHVWNLGCAMRCLYFSGPAMAEAEIFKNCSGFREELIRQLPVQEVVLQLLAASFS